MQKFNILTSRIRWLFPILILLSIIACGVEIAPGLLNKNLAPGAPSLPTATFTLVQPSPSATVTALPTTTETSTATAIAATQPPATPTAVSRPASPPTETALAEIPFQLIWHPDGPLYVGDTVSLEIIPPAGENVAGKTVDVQLDLNGDKQPLGSAHFEPFGLGERLQATFWWFWDTANLGPGSHTLDFSITPGGPTWQQTVELFPARDLPPDEAGAHWVTADSQCCELHFISGTVAERDLAKLLQMADEQASDVSQKLGIQPKEKIPVVLLPRVLGHGGFTAGEIAVSYLDRNYAGNATSLVLHHEIVHWLDGKLGGDLRPSLLVEGLAVYLTGGHFKPEPLMPRAAALLPPLPGCEAPKPTGLGDQVTPTGPPVPESPAPTCGLDKFIPLAELANNFYPSQHEIGYLEASALIEYMVKTWGWPAFSSFYRDIHPLPQTTPTAPAGGPPPAPNQSAAIDAALHKHFNLGLDDLQKAFIAALRQETLTPALVEDVRLSVEYFDTMRRYQKLMDPSAYYLYAWLADTKEMRKRGLVADLIRHPDGIENQALEVMFVQADEWLRAADYKDLDSLMISINAVLDSVEAGDNAPFDADARAADYYAMTQVLHEAGYEPQRIDLGMDKANVWATQSGIDLLELGMERRGQSWVITNLPKFLSWEMPTPVSSVFTDIHITN